MKSDATFLYSLKVEFNFRLKRFDQIGNENDSLPEAQRQSAFIPVEKEYDFLIGRLCELFLEISKFETISPEAANHGFALVTSSAASFPRQTQRSPRE